MIEDKKGGINQCLWFLNLLKILASSNWAVKKATPEPITILKEIKSNWLNEKYNETAIPHTKPIFITLFVKLIPCTLFAKSVTKKAIGYVKAPHVKIFSRFKNLKGIALFSEKSVDSLLKSSAGQYLEKTFFCFSKKIENRLKSALDDNIRCKTIQEPMISDMVNMIIKEYSWN